MSHAKSWENLEIWSFNQDAIKVDNEMLPELDRLQQKFNTMYSLYWNPINVFLIYFNNNKIKYKF